MKKYAFASTLLATLALIGCSKTEDEILGSENDGDVSLKITTRAEGVSEANYAHSAFLVSAGNIESVKSATSLAALEAFSVEPGDYLVYATAANDISNITFSGNAVSDAVSGTAIKINDISAQIPDLLVGKSNSITIGSADATANIELTRVVASIDVTVNGLESVTANTITLTINNMYDKVDIEGNLLKSGESFASKTITLNKNTEGKYKGNAIVMPTDADAQKLSFSYNVNGSTYTSTPTGKILPNGQYEIETNVQGGTTTTYALKSEVSYKAWSTSVKYTDGFSLEEPATKEWVKSALAIGGAPAPDNFWASSDAGGTDWGESYYSTNLFDGNKTDGSNYWCPADWDRTAPCWYINLGAAKQGVTVDYWNKSGGKGGQKIKTMNIYASNTKADYDGGNSDWVLITSFTSDKTEPTVDAGAQITTDLIKFSEDGNTSYQFVKCVITSKVDPNNNIITDALDVNVGEVEISTWLFE